MRVVWCCSTKGMVRVEGQGNTQDYKQMQISDHLFSRVTIQR